MQLKEREKNMKKEIKKGRTETKNNELERKKLLYGEKKRGK